MKLAVLNLTGGGLSGGYYKYLRQVVPLLRADPRIEALQVFMPLHTPWPGHKDVEILSWPPGDSWVGYRRLRVQLRRLAPDVVFIPTARWLDCRPIPTVVMVRNMEPLAVPFGGNSIIEGVKNVVRAYIARVACGRANQILAVSQYVCDFLTRHWKINPQKIGLVYHGVEPVPISGATIKPHVLDGNSLARFILTAGSIRPARGLEDLIRAMAIVGARDPALTLVIAGQADSGTQSYRLRMQRLAEDLGVVGRIVWAGQLKPLEMAWCYDRTELFVATSRAEACPNVALEAMSHGCQVISTHQPPMPEFFGEVALYYRPKDPNDLAGQIGVALGTSPEERRAKQLASQARAQNFKWSETARKTIDLLEAVARRDK